jgi:hypothetical protein
MDEQPSCAHGLHWAMYLYSSEPHLGIFDEADELSWRTYAEVNTKQQKNQLYFLQPFIAFPYDTGER